MTDKIRVLDTYDVFVGTGLIKNLPSLISLKNYSKIFVITDPLVGEQWFEKIQSSIPLKIEKIEIDAGEKAKNIETVKDIWEKLLLANCDRKSLIINLGGGVAGDMGGFAASTFMRGIDFLQIPTTLLSQVDASVGGKVGIDFGNVKNLIGAFNQPIAVVIDTQTLKTLPDREFIAGFAEIIKHGLISDFEYFNLVTSRKPLDFDNKELEKIILKSCQIKAGIVSKDEKESGLRKLLNFGHTAGHAIEALSLETDNPLLHGEAVSIGMIVAAKISQLLGNISKKDFASIKIGLINAGLPVLVPNLPISKILDKIKSDKKGEKGEINWTLLKKAGKAIINQKVDEKIVISAIKQNYEFAN